MKFDPIAHSTAAAYDDMAMRDIFGPCGAFRPPKRVSVSTGAAENLVIKQTGGAAAPWSAEETPYMVEPTDLLASRQHEGVVFVGPARTGKTAALLLGWMTHAVLNDPGDMLMVQMSQEKARDFSKTDIKRALHYSPNLKEALSHNGKEDNLHDKMFKNGMWLKIAWPTVSNLSGSTYRYAAFTDYDRMPDDIGGEGAPWFMGKKRTTTFMSRGMAMAESSPGRDLVDPNWRAATPHEAPPCTGLLSLYNTSDRRRWYWKCPCCAEWFEAKPGLDLFNLPDEHTLGSIVREANLITLAEEYNRIVCPNNGCVITFDQRPALNRGGRWLMDGQRLTEDDQLIGDPLTSTIGGFWLGGVAAAFQSWKGLLMAQFQALRTYETTGSEEALKNTANLDQGIPYMSRLLRDAAKMNNDPADRKKKNLLRFIVPDETRFIVASVDVQGGVNARFIVQVHAVGPNLEQWLIDRYEIKDSTRPGMGSEFAPIDPASYAEDWNILTERVVRATYRTSDEEVEMRVKLTVVDTGGEDGVTDKAYTWYRTVRRLGIGNRVMLIKGDGVKGVAMVTEKMQGNPKGKGDVPVYFLNTDLLKDAVTSNLKRMEDGPGAYHFPDWLSVAFFDELKAEVRQANGKWMQVRKRNESLDLCVYILAGCMRMGADKIKWSHPPVWALPIASNSERVTRDVRRELQANTPVSMQVDKKLVEMAREEVKAAPRQRRTASSPYMR